MSSIFFTLAIYTCIDSVLHEIMLAGFGAASAPSGFGTNFGGLGAGSGAFGQTQCRPATSGTTPFSMC